MPGPHHMSQSDAARIQSSQAKGGHDVGKGSFAAHAQSAAQHNANAGVGQNQGHGSHGKGGSSGAPKK